MKPRKRVPAGTDESPDAWTVVGRRLREVDPAFFARLLAMARRTVGIHENPMRVIAEDAGVPYLPDEPPAERESRKKRPRWRWN